MHFENGIEHKILVTYVIAKVSVNEFINISCIGLVEYQLVSFLNLNNHEERIIYNLINKFLYKSKDLDIVSS